MRLMGFGHRVYKNFDPRAQMLRTVTERLLERLGKTGPAAGHCTAASKRSRCATQYFVDASCTRTWTSYGIIMRAIGIPADMFTVLFAIGRLPGLDRTGGDRARNKGGKIARPRARSIRATCCRQTTSLWRTGAEQSQVTPPGARPAASTTSGSLHRQKTW